MNGQSHNRTDAERAITSELDRLQNRAATLFRGHEKSALIEIVRSLDIAAVTKLVAPRDPESDRNADRWFYVGVGAAVALRPFLAAVKDMAGGVPWARSPTEFLQFWETYLDSCGKLAHLRRMAALERYGLASTSMSAGRLVIESHWGVPEIAAMQSLRAWSNRSVNGCANADDGDRQKKVLWQRMRSYVDRDPRFLIRYDNDLEIVSSYRNEARIYGSRYFEGEALPHDVIIGDRTFEEWKQACDHALGRILCHIDFALLLRQKRSKKVSLRNVLTIFARRDDVAAVWREAGLRADRIGPTMAALTLTIDGIHDWERAYEMPTPFYVDLGKDFVLLSCFGALANPYFALFRHLRSAYKADWDRGVDRRERIFRADLERAFDSSRFLVPKHGFTLRRADGSAITDVDATIFDRQSGRLALVQLKWHDVFGRSLAERESRRRNIGEANTWVERVHAWVNGRSSADALRAIGLHGIGSSEPPVLLVIARYVARFSGKDDQDVRAGWLGWPEVLQAIGEYRGEDPLAHLSRFAAEARARLHHLPDVHEEFRFPGLVVEVRISSS